jgi:putative membrane protein insertion efficiency factor
MTDPASMIGRRRGRTSACDSCDVPCEGCDLPCDLFHIGMLAAFALTVPNRPPRRRTSGTALAGIAAIRAYQRLLSSRLPTACRHTPTCSGYSITAIRRYGLATGSRLTIGRISRCTADVPPMTADPVP